MPAPKNVPTALRLAASLELTIVAMVALMVLVVACTLAQVHLGTFGAVKAYIRSTFVYWAPPQASWRVPIFPGGALVGVVLLGNLMAAHWLRLERSWRKAGMWIIHLGLILLFAGEFVTAAFQTDSQLAVEEGQTKSYSEEARRMELVLLDTSDPAQDKVYAVPQELLSRGGDIKDPRLPVTLSVRRYLPNSSLEKADAPGGLATQGVGLSVAAFEAPPVSRDDEVNRVAAYVEVKEGGKSLGTWLLSNGLGAPQGFSLAGRSYSMAIRPVRHYFPFTLTLADFRHDVYPGTDIPKNFSSLVRLAHPAKGQDREVLISMNNPLRYEGKTFFQSSFGKNDTLSIFQVIENPGWQLPYISCVLVAAGLLIHFLSRLRGGLMGRGA